MLSRRRGPSTAGFVLRVVASSASDLASGVVSCGSLIATRSSCKKRLGPSGLAGAVLLTTGVCLVGDSFRDRDAPVKPVGDDVASSRAFCAVGELVLVELPAAV